MSQQAENILVIKLSALGDFVIALGAMEAIRKHHKDAKITLLTTKPFVDIAEASGYFDEVLVTKRHKWWDILGWLKLRAELGKRNFKRVYDLQLNGRTNLYYKLFWFGKKPEWSGVVEGTSLQYKNPNWRDMHVFTRHKEILKVASIENIGLPDLKWAKANISFYRLKKPYVVLVPGCSPLWPEKKWPSMKYAGLAKRLSASNMNVVIMGTEADSDDTRRVALACPEAIDLTGQTSLLEVLAITKDAFMTIGNDTGPMHMAAIAGSPIIVLFSSASDPEISAPRGKDVVIIQTDDLMDLSVKDVWEQYRKLRVSLVDDDNVKIADIN